MPGRLEKIPRSVLPSLQPSGLSPPTHLPHPVHLFVLERLPNYTNRQLEPCLNISIMKINLPAIPNGKPNAKAVQWPDYQHMFYLNTRISKHTTCTPIPERKRSRSWIEWQVTQRACWVMIWRGLVGSGSLETASKERTGACREAGDLWRHLVRSVSDEKLINQMCLTLSIDELRCRWDEM